MKVLFTKSNLPLSKWIRGITHEPVSHVALEFPEFGIVIQSNLLGVGIVWADYFRKHETVVYELQKNTDDPKDKECITEFLDKNYGSWYDFGALIFAGLCIGLKRLLPFLPMPKKNLWHASGTFTCTEFVSDEIFDHEETMITPYQLYHQLQATDKWTTV